MRPEVVPERVDFSELERRRLAIGRFQPERTDRKINIRCEPRREVIGIPGNAGALTAGPYDERGLDSLFPVIIDVPV